MISVKMRCVTILDYYFIFCIRYIVLKFLNGPIRSGLSFSEKHTWRNVLFSTIVPMSELLGSLYILLKDGNEFIFRFVFLYTVS